MGSGYYCEVKAHCEIKANYEIKVAFKVKFTVNGLTGTCVLMVDYNRRLMHIEMGLGDWCLSKALVTRILQKCLLKKVEIGNGFLKRESNKQLFLHSKQFEIVVHVCFFVSSPVPLPCLASHAYKGPIK